MDGLTGNNFGLVGEGRTAKNTGLEQERNEANDDGLERETSKVNNAGTERERSGINEAGSKNGQREGNNQFASKRKYLKEATVIVNVEEINEVRAMDIIKAVTEKYGNGKILALRPRQGKEYELTMENEKEEEGGGDIQVGGQVHEGSNEEEQSATPAQAQQIPAEEDENGAEATNEVIENERDNQTGQTVDLSWTPMEITPSFKDLLEAAEKDEQKEQTHSERKEKEGQTEKDKIVRRQTRRSLKVTPKLDIPKKAIKKGQIKHRNRYEVLKGLEEEKED
ncbi:hypothetical protein QQF64_023558 [Cirrhinus molitorella]|uniref:Uncharacterized protein n=1 Tax=Cirrhinus molitorella TaxID=172907 RepID=A0ABR3NIR9_9TELE